MRIVRTALSPLMLTVASGPMWQLLKALIASPTTKNFKAIVQKFMLQTNQNSHKCPARFNLSAEISQNANKPRSSRQFTRTSWAGRPTTPATVARQGMSQRPSDFLSRERKPLLRHTMRKNVHNALDCIICASDIRLPFSFKSCTVPRPYQAKPKRKCLDGSPEQRLRRKWRRRQAMREQLELVVRRELGLEAHRSCWEEEQR